MGCFHVLHENRLVHFGGSNVVDVGIEFIVNVEAAEIHVGRAYLGKIIVTDESLGMDKTAGALINPDARFQTFGEIRPVGRAHETKVSLLRNHDTDIHATQGRRLQRLEHRLGRNEIRSLNINVVLGILHSPDRPHIDIRPSGLRLVGDNLNQTVTALEFETHIETLNRSLGKSLGNSVALHLVIVRNRDIDPIRGSDLEGLRRCGSIDRLSHSSIDKSLRPIIGRQGWHFRAHREIFRKVIVNLAVGGYPCVEETVLETGDRIARDAHVGVTPADEIIITDVHASCIADFAVNDNYLPVVAIVKLRDHVHERPTRLGELLHLDASLLHLVIITRKNGDIGDVLMNESDLDTLTRLLHEHFLYLLAAFVLTEIKIFHVDMVLGIPEVFHQQFELAVA